MPQVPRPARERGGAIITALTIILATTICLSAFIRIVLRSAQPAIGKREALSRASAETQQIVRRLFGDSSSSSTLADGGQRIDSGAGHPLVVASVREQPVILAAIEASREIPAPDWMRLTTASRPLACPQWENLVNRPPAAGVRAFSKRTCELNDLTLTEDTTAAGNILISGDLVMRAPELLIEKLIVLGDLEVQGTLRFPEPVPSRVEIIASGDIRINGIAPPASGSILLLHSSSGEITIPRFDTQLTVDELLCRRSSRTNGLRLTAEAPGEITLGASFSFSRGTVGCSLARDKRLWPVWKVLK